MIEVTPDLIIGLAIGMSIGYFGPFIYLLCRTYCDEITRG